MARSLAWLCALTLVFLGRTGHAQTADEARATELRRRADELLLARHAAESIELYDAAYALAPDLQIRYNRGRAYESAGRYPEALADLEAFAQGAPPAMRERVPGLGEYLARVRGKVATVHLTCNVPGARVRLGEREVGVTPLERDASTNAGIHVLEVLKEGYLPYRRELPFPGGGRSEIDVRLASRTTEGVVLFTSPITGATVLVDGQARGDVPLEVTLPAGAHEVLLTHAGHRARSGAVLVVAGERREVAWDLSPVRPVYATWWFWASASVVLVGGGVLTYALVTEKPLDKGSLGPGSVRTGFQF